MKRLRAAVGLACLSAAAAFAACDAPDGQIVADGPVRAAWQPVPGPIAVGRPFALRVTLCPETAVLLGVDATMPEHRHGMNYRPSVKPLGAGRWQVEGLLWHMSGRWELRLDVQADGATHRLRQSVMLQ